MVDPSDDCEERIIRWQRERGGVVITDSDVRVLIGLLAVLEAQDRGDGLDQHLSTRLAARFNGGESPLPASDLPDALSALNQRLRQARGEYSV